MDECLVRSWSTRPCTYLTQQYYCFNTGEISVTGVVCGAGKISSIPSPFWDCLITVGWDGRGAWESPWCVVHNVRKHGIFKTKHSSVFIGWSNMMWYNIQLRQILGQILNSWKTPYITNYRTSWGCLWHVCWRPSNIETRSIVQKTETNNTSDPYYVLKYIYICIQFQQPVS